MLDVGSSTGGFTDYALQHGAKEVIAIDVGTNQLHPKLREDSRVELHEKTDIRNVFLQKTESRDVSHELRANKVEITQVPDVILIDVSFISMRMILPHISSLISHNSQVVAMLKPQFEASRSQLNKGIVKNSKYRRDILHGFEGWCLENGFVILKKSDSAVAGEKGNVERFYLLKKLQ